ncbi:spermatogenesis-associated protein 4-like isoform X1 [Dendronephthya gigantea]|uniref:spermatogenesis-associated protein 4-like isoform X1 n=1 Tax=Dendronephthya gigantea TaxID=151771 RepID=UPI00106D363A|nr:spermatogenesis-associated protein 4-like isoform X1 [Dendronephthya gigantea]
MSGLPRDILKWIQSLDLSHPVRNSKRDFSNGYLVAEIFSWYYPQEVTMHSYANGTSLEAKVGNWSQLTRFFQKQSFDIPKELVDGVIHCKPGAAQLFVQIIYSLLTNRSLKTVQANDVDFTDFSYQNTLPLHARSTASQSVKNNISNSELCTEPDKITCTQKAELIINKHVERRKQERMGDPGRYGIKPSLGERSIRKPPTFDTAQSYQTNATDETSQNFERLQLTTAETEGVSTLQPDQLQELNVEQHEKHFPQFSGMNSSTATNAGIYSY